MTPDELAEYIDCFEVTEGAPRVRARERKNLEFKLDFTVNSLAKCLKTIAAFGSANGGVVVFGISDRPRQIVGTDGEMDEAAIQDQLFRHLYPVPEVVVYEHVLSGCRLVCLVVSPVSKKPVVAIKDKQTSERQNKTVLNAGTVYFRRAGQTKPITGEEFSSVLDRRDERVRSEIMNYISRGRNVGFDKAVVADFRRAGASNDHPTLYVPESEAHRLNIIDRARLVESDGAKAYEIAGTVELTTPSDRDPRKPMLPEAAARALRPPIRRTFGDWFPWTFHHLRKAASQLGFWDNEDGDKTNTGRLELTNSPVYFEEGRAAIERFANRSPSEFVEAVGSQNTIAHWSELRRQADEVRRQLRGE